jgi:hypothetical protein
VLCSPGGGFLGVRSVVGRWSVRTRGVFGTVPCRWSLAGRWSSSLSGLPPWTTWEPRPWPASRGNVVLPPCSLEGVDLGGIPSQTSARAVLTGAVRAPHSHGRPPFARFTRWYLAKPHDLPKISAAATPLYRAPSVPDRVARAAASRPASPVGGDRQGDALACAGPVPRA